MNLAVWTGQTRVARRAQSFILRVLVKKCQTSAGGLDASADSILARRSRKAGNWLHMKTVAIIPARLASTRLPRKMLREIAGTPLVGWVYEAVLSSPLLFDVIIATDSEEILTACNHHGWKARMTSSAHRSGTERVKEVADDVAADAYLNVQGDEPMVRPEQIAALLDGIKDPSVQVGTLKTPCPPQDINNPNAVKVAVSYTHLDVYKRQDLRIMRPSL